MKFVTTAVLHQIFGGVQLFALLITSNQHSLNKQRHSRMSQSQTWLLSLVASSLNFHLPLSHRHNSHDLRPFSSLTGALQHPFGFHSLDKHPLPPTPQPTVVPGNMGINYGGTQPTVGQQ